jgi:hypothetical protein
MVVGIPRTPDVIQDPMNLIFDDGINVHFGTFGKPF